MRTYRAFTSGGLDDLLLLVVLYYAPQHGPIPLIHFVLSGFVKQQRKKC
jgi:hypothetical protein